MSCETSQGCSTPWLYCPQLGQLCFADSEQYAQQAKLTMKCKGKVWESMKEVAGLNMKADQSEKWPTHHEEIDFFNMGFFFFKCFWKSTWNSR